MDELLNKLLKFKLSTECLKHSGRIYKEIKKKNYPFEYQIIALLHDVLKETNSKQQQMKLLKKEFGRKILNKVKLLTFKEDTNYNKYILNLRNKDRYLFSIKIYDISDNLSNNPIPEQILKYKEAFSFLKKNRIFIPKLITEKLKEFG